MKRIGIVADCEPVLSHCWYLAPRSALQNRKDALLKQLEVADEPPPLLHPTMAELYRSKVEELAEALQREDTRLEA